MVSQFLKKRGRAALTCSTPNSTSAEAHIVAQAGLPGARSHISTNMAGRGTDILLGGNPEVLARAEVGSPPQPRVPSADDPEAVPFDPKAYEQQLVDHEERSRAAVEAIPGRGQGRARRGRRSGRASPSLGTERHESRQMRQSAARSGRPAGRRRREPLLSLARGRPDAGSSGSDRIKGMMETLGMKDGRADRAPRRPATRPIEGAQKKVEGHNFDIRKNLLEYDDVMNQQRKTIYALRREVLAAGAGEPLVEYIEKDPITRRKERQVRTIEWADQREKDMQMAEDVILDDLLPVTAPTQGPETWELLPGSRTWCASSSISRSTSASRQGRSPTWRSRSSTSSRRPTS